MTPFERGFIKAAAENDIPQDHAQEILNSILTPAGAGAGIGAAAGGMSGYLLGKSKDPNKDRRGSGALLGGLAGAGLGGAYGANSGFEDLKTQRINQLLKENTTWDQLKEFMTLGNPLAKSREISQLKNTGLLDILRGAM